MHQGEEAMICMISVSSRDPACSALQSCAREQGIPSTVRACRRLRRQGSVQSALALTRVCARS
eukprot:3349875-Pleurochrysis_carterae.AAC.2